MTLWGVFVTGLVAGGASCAAIQGGLLAGLVARRQPVPSGPLGEDDPGGMVDTRRQPARLDDAIPVGGFLVGKLVSHTILGAGLGMLGDAVQVGFRTRAFIQIVAGAMRPSSSTAIPHPRPDDDEAKGEPVIGAGPPTANGPAARCAENTSREGRA